MQDVETEGSLCGPGLIPANEVASPSRREPHHLRLSPVRPAQPIGRPALPSAPPQRSSRPEPASLRRPARRITIGTLDNGLMEDEMAKCPRCENSLTEVKAERVSVKTNLGPWIGLIYSCPSCASALSVSIDPIALKDDAVREIAAALGR